MFQICPECNSPNTGNILPIVTDSVLPIMDIIPLIYFCNDCGFESEEAFDVIRLREKRGKKIDDILE
jgi:hypothetical protein